MPAPIVYDGVSGGGNRDDLLFSGIKFWLALRVPSRLKFKEKIQSNGGEVVPMERQADILIADDAAPKKAPSNWDSYSWKFIDAAIEKGELPDKADYLIPRPTSAATATRASIPANGSSKGTRTPFTAEDDRILTECARRQLCAPQGPGMKGSLKGITFWADFAAKNPRHTAQSWRDRWLKKLAHLPGNDEPLDAEPEETTAHASREQTACALTESSPRSKSPRPKSNPQVPLAKARTAKEGGRQRFTPAEDEALIEAVDEARRLGENIGGKLFYEEFAKANPTHTAESWRSRYHRTLAPRLFPDGLPASDDQPEETRRVVTNTSYKTKHDRRDQPDNSRGQASQANDGDPTKNADDIEDPPTPEAREAQPRETRTPPAQSPKSAGDSESMERHHNQSQTPTTPTHDRHTAIRSDEIDTYHEFYDLLGEYVKVCPNTIDTKPRIRGVRLDLFKLQQAVESQDGDLDECDWSLVCEDIGFESPDPELAKTVEACYRTNLQGFIEFYLGFEEGCSELVSPESDLGSRILVNQDEGSGLDTVLPQASSPGHEEHIGSDDELPEVQFGPRSSPTPRHLGKRHRTTEAVNGRRKRKRLSRDLEIPDTPQVNSKLRDQTAFDDPENGVNEEDEGEENGDFQGTQDPLDNSSSQQLRSEHGRSVSSRNNKQTSSQDNTTAGANGRNKAPIVEKGEPVRYADRDRPPKQGQLPEALAATCRINKNFDPKSASSRTVSGVSTRLTHGANLPPRSAQPHTIPVRSTPVKKPFKLDKEAPVRPRVFSTPKPLQRPTASKPMGMSSPLSSIPNDILSDIISPLGPRRQPASLVTPSASSRRVPDTSRRPSAQRNSLGGLHYQAQTILPSIEGGHDSIASTSRCSEEVKRLAALGYRQDFINKLLHATSGDVTVMKKVCELKAQKKAMGYRAAGPSESMPNMRGVWTAEEDRKLIKIYEFDQMDDADKTAVAKRTKDQDERVLKQKHGWEGALEARKRFLMR
ncbi:hypothetical protein MGG_00809 [Pyricularia oryzae 70-15]|uniref:DNA-binding protein RAP1 n=1 Tax=Pyricularia oryzae (strain 70-15 / ATCC MYA-4617 / FGSC 8958) TaxID=242507 RepID=G4NEA8_PYRO7|nr:uncharacterized protein MGG_00809 [Pyricularia oryzae 70-15]EHA48591.1 hypothetical protein MGG_00809 [Pyricularia oryzae 70-15]KAI7920183.1 hypothetical protein M9X92_006028 [Pyricularia oryzae]KAI7924504.1 hypothetical protein M0657_004548 [Pyricularia oryzae]